MKIVRNKHKFLQISLHYVVDFYFLAFEHNALALLLFCFFFEFSFNAYLYLSLILFISTFSSFEVLKFKFTLTSIFLKESKFTYLRSSSSLFSVFLVKISRFMLHTTEIFSLTSIREF